MSLKLAFDQLNPLDLFVVDLSEENSSIVLIPSMCIWVPIAFYQGPLADMDLSLHDFSFCGWPQVV